VSSSAVRVLDLRAPLFASDEERLWCFTLDPKTAFSPDAGAARAEDYFVNAAGTSVDQIPPGRYLFHQSADDADGEASAAVLFREAVELQKEGLWRGETLDDRLYLRELAEEGAIVRQVLRPLADLEKH
jgi:hypothetical protein